jgi:hypothetical protein
MMICSSRIRTRGHLGKFDDRRNRPSLDRAVEHDAAPPARIRAAGSKPGRREGEQRDQGQCAGAAEAQLHAFTIPSAA